MKFFIDILTVIAGLLCSSVADSDKNPCISKYYIDSNYIKYTMSVSVNKFRIDISYYAAELYTGRNKGDSLETTISVNNRIIPFKGIMLSGSGVMGDGKLHIISSNEMRTSEVSVLTVIDQTGETRFKKIGISKDVKILRLSDSIIVILSKDFTRPNSYLLEKNSSLFFVDTIVYYDNGVTLITEEQLATFPVAVYNIKGHDIKYQDNYYKYKMFVNSKHELFIRSLYPYYYAYEYSEVPFYKSKILTIYLDASDSIVYRLRVPDQVLQSVDSVKSANAELGISWNSFRVSEKVIGLMVMFHVRKVHSSGRRYNWKPAMIYYMRTNGQYICAREVVAPETASVFEGELMVNHREDLLCKCW